MSQGRTSLTSISAVHQRARSNSVPDNTLPVPRKNSRERRSFDTMASTAASDPLQDGKLLVLKVIGKVNLRIERKEYQELIRIVNQLPGDVLVLILDNLSIEALYSDIPSSLASLAAVYSKIFYDRKGKFPDRSLRSDDFVHHLVRYFADVLKYNNQTFASARSRDQIKTVFSICTQIDDSLHERLLRRVEQMSTALEGFSAHTLVETIQISSATYYMRMHEALKMEIERAASHYKSALTKVSEVLLKVPHESVDLAIQMAGNKQAEMEERTVQYVRKLSGQVIEDRLFFNQSLLNAVEIHSRDKLMVNGLIDKLESRIHHDKEVLQLLSQLRKEFNISRDEKVLPLLERFHHGHRLVLQLLEESLKGVVTHGGNLTVPSPLNHSVERGGAESGDVSTCEDGCGSDTDVFDTVTQLDEETEFSAISSPTSSSETDSTSKEISAEHKKAKPEESRTEGRKQETHEQLTLRKELENKQKELEKAQEMVQHLKKREKDLVDRLQDQAQRQLKKGGKFEDVSTGACRPSSLIERYDNLYTQTRVDALDDLDEVQSLEKLDENGDIKNKILFSVMVVSFRAVQQALTKKKNKLRKLLEIPDNDKTADHAQNMHDHITEYFRQTGARLRIDSVKKDVSKQLWDTLFDFPELQSCDKLTEYIDECVRLSWMLAVQLPPMIIDHETTEFSEQMHGRLVTSDMTSIVIKYHVWPALIDSQDSHVLYKGVVVT